MHEEVGYMVRDPKKQVVVESKPSTLSTNFRCWTEVPERTKKVCSTDCVLR